MRRNNLINQTFCSLQLGGNISKFFVTDVVPFSLVQFLYKKTKMSVEHKNLILFKIKTNSEFTILTILVEAARI